MPIPTGSPEEGSAGPPYGTVVQIRKRGPFLICWKIVIRNRKMYDICDVSEVIEKQRKLAWATFNLI